MGYAPPWYYLVRAARYLGTPPWVLAKQEPMWVTLALESEGAETRAANHKAEQERRRAKRRKAK